MTLFEVFIIASLATYRLTAMLNEEAGPGDIFTNFRTRIGVRYDEHSRPFGTNWVAKGVLCFYCLSVWIGFAVFLFIVLTALVGFPVVGNLLLFPFALSGVAVFLKKWAG